jgi:glyceraldehyde-3-phosphate dehydrogenase (ferredoxin)
VFWESERNVDFMVTQVKRPRDVDPASLATWTEKLERDKNHAALEWWYEMRKGIDESLRAFL